MKGSDTVSVAETVMGRDEDDGADTLREQTLPEAFESLLATIADGLRGVLLVMTKKTSASLVGTSLNIVVDDFQLIAFTMTQATLEKIDTTGMLTTISDGLSFFQISGKLIQGLGFVSTLACAVSLVLVELFIIAYVAHSWTKKRFEFLWAIKALRYSASLLVGVLYIPIVSVMGKVIDCDGISDSMDPSLCRSLQPFVLTVMGLFILVSLVLSSAFFDANPASGSPASKPHSRVDVFHLIIKTAASLLSIAHSSLSYGLEIWHVFLAVSGVLLAALNIWYLPWFHPTVLSLRCMCMAVFGWVASFVCICVFLRLPENPLILVLSSLLVLPLANLLALKRMDELAARKIQDCKDCFEVEIKVRSMLLHSNNMFKKRMHHVHPEYAPVNDSEEVFQKANELYQHAVLQLRNSSLICAFHAEFVHGFNLKSCTLFARKAVLLGESRRPYFDASFMLFNMRNRLKQKVATDGDVMSYVASEKYEREAKDADRKCCKMLLEFWKELGCRRPDMNRVRKLAAQAAELSHRANTAYRSLVQVQPRSARALSMYSGFLNDVANDRMKANQFAQKALYLNSKDGKRLEQDPLAWDISDLFPVIVFSIGSSKQQSFGEILIANGAAAESLNEPSERLIGCDVRSFVVPPLSTDLDSIIAEFFETGTTSFSNGPQKTFILTAQKDCVEVELRLVPYTTDGMAYNFFLTWSPCTYNNFMWRDGQPFILIESVNIIACSRPCILFLERNTMLASPLTIGEIFRNYSVIFEAASDDSSKTVEVQLSFPKEENEEGEEGKTFLISVDKICDGILKVVLHISGMDTVDGEENFDDNDDVEACEDSASVGAENSGAGSTGNESISAAQTPDEGIGQLLVLEGASFTARNLNRRVFVASELDQNKSQQRQFGNTEPKEEEEHSQAESSSVVSAVAIRSALRSQGNSTALSPIIAKLRRSYLEVLVLVAVCASIVLVVQYSLLHTFAANVEFTEQAGLRRTCTVSIAFATHSLLLLNQGVGLHAFMDERFARDEILNSATQLMETDNLLFEKRKLLSAELQSLYEVPSTSLRYLINEEVVTRKHTLFDASSKLAGKAIQAANAPLRDFTLESDMVFFLMNNIGGNNSFLSSLHESTQRFSYDTKKLQSQILLVTVTLMGAVLVLEVVVMVVVMTPIVGGIEENRTKVLNVFSGIPVGTVRDIVSRFQDRLSNVHGVLMDVIIDEDATHEQTRKSGVSVGLGSVGLGSVSLGSVFESKSGTGAKRGENKKMKQSGKKTSRKTVGSRQKFFLFKLGSIIILSLGYFTVSLYFGVFAFKQTLENASQVANLGGLRRTFAKQSLHLMRLLASGTVVAYKDHDFTIRKDDILNVLDQLMVTEKAVVFGDEIMDITGLVSLKNPPPEEISLMFSDGCVHWVSTVHTHEECIKFNFGMFSSGLHGVLVDFIHSMTEIVENFHNQPSKEELTITGDGKPILRMDNPKLINKTFTIPEIEIISELENWFLQPQLTVSVLVFSEKLDADLIRLDSLRISFFAVYLSLLVSMYIFVARRVIKVLDAEVKHTRSLLLMIPEDALDGLRSVQKFLSDELRDNLTK